MTSTLQGPEKVTYEHSDTLDIEKKYRRLSPSVRLDMRKCSVQFKELKDFGSIIIVCQLTIQVHRFSFHDSRIHGDETNQTKMRNDVENVACYLQTPQTLTL